MANVDPARSPAFPQPGVQEFFVFQSQHPKPGSRSSGGRWVVFVRVDARGKSGGSRASSTSGSIYRPAPPLPGPGLPRFVWPSRLRILQGLASSGHSIQGFQHPSTSRKASQISQVRPLKFHSRHPSQLLALEMFQDSLTSK